MAENKVTRNFPLTTLALTNRNTILLMTLIIALFGVIAYKALPKELFPDVQMPTVYVQTNYFGNPPEDIENLITRPLEKELKTVKGVDNVKSTSAQDASMIFVEFNTNVDIKDALTDVKDAVDKAKSELPNDPLLNDPVVMDLDFSGFPILTINLSGDYSIDDFKNYAEYLEDEIESVYEVSKVDIKGSYEKEIQINVDPHKLSAVELSMRDIEEAIGAENVSVSGGEIRVGGTRRSIRTVGEYASMEEIRNTIVKNNEGNIVYLKDVADVVDGYEEPKSYASHDRKPVVSLQVVKKSGENLLNAAEQTLEILALAKKSGEIPPDINISITTDQSKDVKSQLDNLWNSMIMGVIFVIVVLFFFLGMRNALFVGLAIPMSMILSFVVLGMMGQTINMIVLFSLILALGMLVDNAIVVVENIYRFVDLGYPVLRAAREATGEIAVAIITSTATTLAAFFPLVFWGGLIGEFMKLLPITLIIVLTSSLFVALVIIPTISLFFVKNNKEKETLNKKKSYMVAGILALMAVGFYATDSMGMGNFIMLFAILGAANALFLYDAARWFQDKFLTWLENYYTRILRFSLSGFKPYLFLISIFVMLFLSLVLFAVRKPNVVFFPVNEPKFVNIIAELPIGTDVRATDSTMKTIEDKVFNVLEPYSKYVESIQTTVGEGVTRQNLFSIGNTPNRGMITVKFVDFEFRDTVKTGDVMRLLSDNLLNKYAGIDIFVEKDENGPPTGAPINLEIHGRNLSQMVAISDSLLNEIDRRKIPGIEGMKLDITVGKPELIVSVNRDHARRFGMSTQQIAWALRTSLFGKEISDYKVGEDEYPVQLRFNEAYRHDLSSIMNQKITFRNNKGKLMQIPISSVATIKPGTSYGTIKRIDQKRVVTLQSNIIEGYNANQINEKLRLMMDDFKMPHDVTYSFTGEQEEQEETMGFLTQALAIAISLILIILVSQFNSFFKPLIILASVFFSTIGVLAGIGIFKMDFVIIMSGIGIISLAGVVVNNSIVLIDYIDFLKQNRKKELGIDTEGNLSINDIVTCILDAGRTRLRPVLLTAITTVLGLVPMAIGFNIDFAGLFERFEPNIYFGGDNALFWGPMAWTVIFGLTFATFLTLIIVPVMYLIFNKAKLWFVRLKK